MKSAGREHLPGIAEIYGHYVETSIATFELEVPDEAEWARRFAAITDSGLPFLVAELDDKVAGYAYCSPWKTRPAYRQTVEDSVYVAPWAVGHGLGGLLLDTVVERCDALGIREIIAVIADTQGASPALHHRRGFVDAGRLRNVGFKHGRRLDTVLMQRSLGQSNSAGSVPSQA
ncbi:GNAT family N-acetyltransferase [Amycolatopsis acididurans]|uniref:GNAT family N-acetyltransferase n=1 Tax=Amycolatopsis acididurans TaxID=2724524 RepID=UPI0028B267E2|nr:N-acetyltransferase family protein [Amycolatopsis acididurans]